jgi:hypothetical protein
MNKLPSTDQLHFSQKRGFGSLQDVNDIFPTTYQVLQVKCTICFFLKRSMFWILTGVEVLSKSHLIRLRKAASIKKKLDDLSINKESLKIITVALMRCFGDVHWRSMCCFV